MLPASVGGNVLSPGPGMHYNDFVSGSSDDVVSQQSRLSPRARRALSARAEVVVLRKVRVAHKVYFTIVEN